MRLLKIRLSSAHAMPLRSRTAHQIQPEITRLCCFLSFFCYRFIYLAPSLVCAATKASCCGYDLLPAPSLSAESCIAPAVRRHHELSVHLWSTVLVLEELELSDRCERLLCFAVDSAPQTSRATPIQHRSVNVLCAAHGHSRISHRQRVWIHMLLRRVQKLLHGLKQMKQLRP